MMKAMEDRKYADLIREVLRSSAPGESSNQLLGIADFTKAKFSEIDAICEILLAELAGSGLDADSEPTSRGLEMEDAIDWIRQFRK